MQTKALHVLCAVVLTVAAPALPRAETVSVEYRGDVDLTPFECTDISKRSHVSRVCYDGANRYLVVKLDEAYRHYCEVEADTAARLLASHSMDHFLRTTVENNHGCRPATVPKYE